jgi:cell division initiation protein
MPLTPVEIRHQELRRSLFGYRRAAVDRLMAEVADSFELVWRERAELADRVEALESEVKRHQELEGLLRSTLVSAERAGQEVKERARREADLIVNEAHAEARTIKRDSIAEKQHLMGEVRRIQALLRSALEVVGEADWIAPEEPVPVSGEARPEPAAGAAALPPAPEEAAEARTDTDVRKLAG